jgi:hypothetical protein
MPSLVLPLPSDAAAVSSREELVAYVMRLQAAIEGGAAVENDTLTGSLRRLRQRGHDRVDLRVADDQTGAAANAFANTGSGPLWTDLDDVAVRQQVSGRTWTAVDALDLATDQMRCRIRP